MTIRRNAASAARLRLSALPAAIPAIPAILVALLFAGCELLSGRTGGGTETESAGIFRNADGSPAVSARVLVRPSEYVADSLLSSEESSPHLQTWTDARGRFRFRGLPLGSYRLEAEGGNGRGLVVDFSLEREGQRLELPAGTLLPHGSISGSFAPDSSPNLGRYVQIYGMERLVKADPKTGAFMVNGLPPGRYDLRCLGLEPFRKQTDIRGVEVVSHEVTHLDPVVLEPVAKLAFTVEDGALAVAGLGPRTPVILDNEYWDNGFENEYAWAKASAGTLDLRGNIVTDGEPGPPSSVDEHLDKARIELREARLAGISGVPDPVAGSRRSLAPAASGRIDDIVPLKSDGSELIVAAARRATPEAPLVVVAGGPLTTVANAYLTDPSIAPRMVVMSVFPFSINRYDSLANYLVAKRCRLIVWGGDYLWKTGMDTAWAGALPGGSRLHERLRSSLRSGWNQLGDMAPIAYLSDRRAWTGAEMAKVSLPLQMFPASSLAFDFLHIPAAANAWPVYGAELLAALGDSNAYAPALLPGRLESEAYSGRFAARGTLTAPGSAPDTSRGDAMAGAAGAWLEFRVSSPADAPARAVVRYRAPAGGRLSLAFAGGPVLAEIILPPAGEWAEVEADMAVEAGQGTLKATWSEGAFDLDWMEIR
jgi:hypothetical protein